MRNLVRAALLACAALLLLPAVSWGADCDALSQRTAGDFTVQPFYLLDSDTASATGTACDTDTWGAASHVRLSVQTCTIAEAEADCSFTTPTDTDIAAGATVAMQAVQTGDNADDDLWCRVALAPR